MFPRPVLGKELFVLREELRGPLPTISVTRAMCALGSVMVPFHCAHRAGGVVEGAFLSSVLILEILNVTFLVKFQNSL